MPATSAPGLSEAIGQDGVRATVQRRDDVLHVREMETNAALSESTETLERTMSALTRQQHELRDERRINAELRAEMHDSKLELDEERWSVH